MLWRLLGVTPENELALVSGVSLLGRYRAPKQEMPHFYRVSDRLASLEKPRAAGALDATIKRLWPSPTRSLAQEGLVQAMEKQGQAR